MMSRQRVWVSSREVDGVDQTPAFVIPWPGTNAGRRTTITLAGTEGPCTDSGDRAIGFTTCSVLGVSAGIRQDVSTKHHYEQVNRYLDIVTEPKTARQIADETDRAVSRVVRESRLLAEDSTSPVEELPGTGRSREACVELLMSRGLNPGIDDLRLAELRRWVVYDGLAEPTAKYRQSVTSGVSVAESD